MVFFFFFPILIILYLVGAEGSLGLLLSISSILNALIIYIIGRKVKNTLKLFIIYVIINFLSAIIFLIGFDSTSTVIFQILTSIASPLSAVVVNTIVLNSIDKLIKIDDNYKYNYIFDREIFLNLGRFCGIILFYILVYLLNSQLALRLIPLVLFFVQILSLIILFNINKIDSKIDNFYNKPS